MSSYGITVENLLRTFPDALKGDPNMLALASSIAEVLSERPSEIDKLKIYSRIDELSEDLLDILAHDLKVDWYDYSYPIEAKRAVIKDSVQVHKHMGTKFAIETAVGNVYPGSKVREWFEYGGDPFFFRIDVDVTKTGAAADLYRKIVKNVMFYKNVRSHLEAVNIQLKPTANAYLGTYHAIAESLTIYPYVAGSLETTAKAYFGGSLFMSSSISIQQKGSET